MDGAELSWTALASARNEGWAAAAPAVKFDRWERYRSSQAVVSQGAGGTTQPRSLLHNRAKILPPFRDRVDGSLALVIYNRRAPEVRPKIVPNTVFGR